MITRNKSRLSNISNDENANIHDKMHGKAFNPRSRAVLCEIENLDVVKIKEKTKKKIYSPPYQCSVINSSAAVRLLHKNTNHLTPEMRANFYKFYKQRLMIRAKCLRKDPWSFPNLEVKIGLKNGCRRDIMECAFDYLQNTEFLAYPLAPRFLSVCDDLTPRMRYILVNWIIQVHQSYKLMPETLFLCLGLLDRYVHKAGNEVSRQIFQLLGVTSLYIAAKFEEMFPPDVGDYSSITEGCFNSTDIVVCEQMILQRLDFLVNIPCPLLFLRRLTSVLEVDGQVHNLSKYFLELSFQEYELAHYPGNFLSTVAMCLALAALAGTHVIDNVWGDKIAYLSGCSIDDVRAPLQILAKAVLRQREPSKYRAIYDKYRVELFQRVSALPQLESQTMRLLSGTLQF